MLIPIYLDFTPEASACLQEYTLHASQTATIHATTQAPKGRYNPSSYKGASDSQAHAAEINMGMVISIFRCCVTV